MSSGTKLCAKCEKTVYPMEVLKCLDKFWHKACFKCETCGMTLNMKNYKGYNKLPYCGVHYPSTSFTSVADTPENKRIASNTKIQSQITYHKDFEQSKGRYTAVTDDPETLRARRNSDQFSTVQYHAQFEKQKGQKISVGVESDPEIQRIRKNSENISQVNYQGWKDKKDTMEKRRPSDCEYNPVVVAPPIESSQPSHPPYAPPPPQQFGIGSIFDRDPLADEGKNDVNYNSPYSARTHSQIVYQSGPRDEGVDQRPRGSSMHGPPPDSVNGQYNQRSSGGDFKAPLPPPQQPPARSRPRFVAMYDYNAADEDEVSFREGDIIFEVENIDEGWMIGRVERTGAHGMLPANYVERLG